MSLSKFKVDGRERNASIYHWVNWEVDLVNTCISFEIIPRRTAPLPFSFSFLTIPRLLHLEHTANTFAVLS